MIRITTLCLWVAVPVVALCSASARAQAIGDKGWIELSGYRPSISSDIQATKNGEGTIGTEVNAERDLGLDKHRILPALHAGLRIGRNWQVDAEFYALKRNAQVSLQRDIVFEDV